MGQAGGAIDQVLERYSPTRKQRWAEELVQFMREKIRDPSQQDEPLWKVAWAIVEGRIGMRDLHSVFRPMEKRRRAGTLASPSSYFNRSIKYVFARRGIPWE